MEVLLIRGRLAKLLRDEAEKRGFSVEEYLAEVLSQGLDLRDRAQEYVSAAEDLLEEAEEESRKSNARQAAEKLRGAAALVVKAYALWREERRLTSHGELWEYKRRLEDELGEWVSDSWYAASAMHTCFYEGWCTERDVAIAKKRVVRLVKEVASMIKSGSKD